MYVYYIHIWECHVIGIYIMYIYENIYVYMLYTQIRMPLRSLSPWECILMCVSNVYTYFIWHICTHMYLHINSLIYFICNICIYTITHLCVWYIYILHTTYIYTYAPVHHISLSWVYMAPWVVSWLSRNFSNCWHAREVAAKQQRQPIR